MSKETQMKRARQLRKSTSACLLAVALGAVGGGVTRALAIETAAGMPDVAVFARAGEVSDDALSHMRGRFISQGQIVQFGVEMLSQWMNPQTGQLLTAGANMNISNLQGGAPQVTFQPNLTIGTVNAVPVNASVVRTATGGGVQNVSGVGQGIQIAGDANGATNSAVITVTTDSIGGTPGAGNGGPQAVTAVNGATVAATVGKGGIGVSIRVPNQGIVMQQISGGSLGGGSGTGLVQMVQATGNLQSIQNMMNLRVQLSSLAMLGGGSNFNYTLSTLQGMPTFVRH
jgi:hypothetical protein